MCGGLSAGRHSLAACLFVAEIYSLQLCFQHAKAVLLPLLVLAHLKDKDKNRLSHFSQEANAQWPCTAQLTLFAASKKNVACVTDVQLELLHSSTGNITEQPIVEVKKWCPLWCHKWALHSCMQLMIDNTVYNNALRLALTSWILPVIKPYFFASVLVQVCL